MKNPFIVRPTGLKGNEKLNRMKELMGTTQLNEDVKKSVVELTKLGPDGKVYGIVREGHNYFIKVTNKTSNILTEDFNYIGGLMNKTSEVYPSYAKAIKQLNLKFMSLNEALGKRGNFNVFVDDNLLSENEGSKDILDKAGEKLSYKSKEGKEEGQFGDNVADKDVEDEFEKVKLSENEMAIDEMITGDDEVEEFIPHGTYTVSNSGGYEIMLSDSNDAAKVRDAFGSENPQVSDWLEIEYDEDGDPVIDPNGYNIPLNMVMRINENKTIKKFSIATALEKMDSIIGEDVTDKVNDLLNSLTESEKTTLLNTLKKKV
jgi:hypothetical protein